MSASDPIASKPLVQLPKEDASVKEWATHYVAVYKWALTPIPPKSKAPIGKSWNHPRGADNPAGYITDPVEAQRTWSRPRNMGVVLEPSGLVSLDVDSLSDSRMALAAASVDLDSVLNGAVQIEGQPRRVRAMYLAPDGVPLPNHKLRWPDPNDPKKSISIFELRAGLVQDVLPPSIHPETRQPYRWLRAPWEAGAVSPLPPELLRLWQEWDSILAALRNACPWGEVREVNPPPKVRSLARNIKFDRGDVLDAIRRAISLDDLLREAGARHAHGRHWHCCFHPPDDHPSLWTFETPDGIPIWIDGHGEARAGRVSADGLGYGDVIDLYQYVHGVGFTEAVRALAERAGIPLATEKARVSGSGPAGDSTAEPESERLTDYGNAERLVRKFGEDLRYCHPTREWFVWDDKRWRHDDTGEVMRRAKSTVRGIYNELTDCTDLNEKKSRFQHATASEREPRLRAMVDLAASEPGIPVLPDDLDRDQFLLNLDNGTLDLRFGSGRPFRAHSREDLLTCLAPVPYDAGATCPRFLQFLDYVMAGDTELVGYLQRLAGYCLTGSVGEQGLFVFYGGGENGKSTLLNILQFVLGDYAMQAPPDLLLIHRKDSHPTGVADLKGKRLVVAIETEAGAKLAESLVKQLTGGDLIRARRMRQDYFQFPPTHKIILAVNHKPVIRGSDHAIWRRIHLVPFGVTVAPEDKDPDLAEKLRMEAPGILAWAVRGCAEWRDLGGLAPPEAVLAATDTYRQEMDVLGGFLEEACVIGPSYRVQATVLYQRYVGWCQAGHEDALNQTDFGTALTGRGLLPIRRGGKVWRIGIGLRAEATDDQDSWIDRHDSTPDDESAGGTEAWPS